MDVSAFLVGGQRVPVTAVDNGDGTYSLKTSGGGASSGLTDTQLRATAVPVSAAALPLPSGAATETTLAAQSAKLPATIGQKAMAASLAVVLASDQSAIPVVGQSAMVRVNLARPANTTAYTAGDAMGDAGGSAIITFAAFGASGDNMLITSATVRYDVAALPSGMAALRLHLYSSSPTAIADNAAWDLVSGDRSAYLGYIDISTLTDMGATLYSQVSAINIHVKLAGTAIYGILQTIAGFTPAANSEPFSVELGGVKL